MSEPHRVVSHEMSMISNLRGSAGLGSAMRGTDMTGGGMMPMAPAWTSGYASLMLGMWAVMKTLPWGGRIARPGGAGLIAGGTAVLAIALAHA